MRLIGLALGLVWVLSPTLARADEYQELLGYQACVEKQCAGLTGEARTRCHYSCQERNIGEHSGLRDAMDEMEKNLRPLEAEQSRRAPKRASRVSCQRECDQFKSDKQV